MMSNFNTGVDFVIWNEATEKHWFSDDKDDPGGVTAWGITARYLTDSNLWKYDRNGDGVIDARDMLKFTRQDAVDVLKLWWDKYNFKRLNSNDLAKRVFDFCINSGQSRGIKTLQEAVNSEDFGKMLVVDGVMGKETISLVNSLSNYRLSKLINIFKKKRVEFYEELAKNRPASRKYLGGWILRAKK